MRLVATSDQCNPRASVVRSWRNKEKSSALTAFGLLRPQFHFCPGPVLDPYRSTDKAKLLPNLVLQETLVRKMQLHVFIGEENERGRRSVSLGHVKNLYLLAVRH